MLVRRETSANGRYPQLRQGGWGAMPAVAYFLDQGNLNIQLSYVAELLRRLS
jgi:hypothetical protein